ncbi:MFS transporter [Flammeovirga sp. EKP202]|uniref:MFS transporter n=1 Tax=Flammeovirga sp. EKP202 TaxID=2770592 RepID=UPI001CB8145D|nr:MFS transporter [Flammeovirga sp. EKP202]
MKNTSVFRSPMYKFLLVLSIATALGFQGWRTLFNNFAVDEIGLNGFDIGAIQSFREVPGFLVVTALFFLMFIKEDRFASISIIVMGIGVGLTGLFPSFWGLMMTTLIMSIGFHYYETSNQSLTLQSFSKEDSPHILARLKSVMAFTNIAIGGAIYGLTFVASYEVIYLLIGVIVVLAGVWALFQKPIEDDAVAQHKKMILKSKYWLFYVLNLLSGARRQVFVVFAVLLLVEKYDFSIKEITVLFVLNNIVSMYFNPIIARMLNKYGERKMLSFEYISLTIVFLAYALIENRWVVAGLYIIDHIFFSFSIGIKTYFQKNADPKDIAPSMAVGFTINHVVAVFLPLLGGWIWLKDWTLPFYGGAILCVISLIFAQFVKVPSLKK